MTRIVLRVMLTTMQRTLVDREKARAGGPVLRPYEGRQTSNLQGSWKRSLAGRRIEALDETNQIGFRYRSALRV